MGAALSGWTPYGDAGAPLRTSEQTLVGSYSLKQAFGSTGGGAWADVGGLVAGQTYEVRAWVREQAGNTDFVGIWLHDTTGANGSGTGWVYLSPGAWQELRADFVATSTGAVRIHLGLFSGSGAAYCYRGKWLRLTGAD